MREWWSKLARALHLRRGLDDDLSDEMRAHLELMTDDNLERGMSTSEARAAARRHFGNLTRTRDRKSTRLNSSHGYISYAVFCLKKKKNTNRSAGVATPHTR